MFWKLCFSFILSNLVFAGYNKDHNNNVAVYWGQGANDTSLRQTCNTGNVDIVLLSFANWVGPESIGFNFGKWCWGRECPMFALDIKYCQKLGIKVLLSMGGDRTLGDYSNTNDTDGEQAGQLLFDMFNLKGNPDVAKPFGNAQIDGFDLDIENHNQAGQVAMYRELRKLWTNKKLILTACPQCTYPDKNVMDVMGDEEVNLDMVFLQFYSNADCSIVYDTFQDHWPKWENYFVNITNATNIKLYATLQADATNKWHANLSYVNQQIGDRKYSSCFGGFGLWEAGASELALDDSLTPGDNMTYTKGIKYIASGVFDDNL